MSDIDTTAIRAEIEQWGELAMSDWVEPLCDALDAARAERDQNWDLGNAMTIGLGVAAEQRDRSIARAEAAEARIAAAFDVLDNDAGLDPIAVLTAVVHALGGRLVDTGDTE